MDPPRVGRDHDPNCGGTNPTVDMSEFCALPFDAHEWLKNLMESQEALQKHCEEVFESATGGEDRMNLDQFKMSTKDLCRPVGETLERYEKSLRSEYDTYSPRSLRHPLVGAGLDVTSFKEICRKALRTINDEYFPPVLCFKTSDLVRRNTRELTEVYDLGDQLGKGTFGVVSLVTHRISNETRVCKKIDKLRGRVGMPLADILREIESMAMLDHPNVIKVYEYFMDDDSVFQIMEPCSGGELQGRIDGKFRERRSDYAEDFICDVIKQTLRALAFMHGERFMHKDLKPQNIMMVDKMSSSIKLIDFGLAELFEPDETKAQVWGGTLLYAAPEGFGQGLEMKSDVWSAGVILYNLITGTYPFMETWPPPPGKDQAWWESGTRTAIETETHRHHPNLTNGCVSEDCVDLMCAMLSKDPRRRPDAAKCLEHCWFRKFDKKPPPLSVGVLQCLDAFAGQPELKKAVFLLIAHQCSVPPRALEDLRAIFTHFDTQNRGTLSAASMREVLGLSGMSHLRAARILHALDRDRSDSVSWTEFVAAALCISVCNNEPLVAAAFEHLPRGGSEASVREVPDLVELFAKGPHKPLWEKQLPAECEKISPGGRGVFTQSEFVQYMSHRMSTIAGDAVQAVS